MAELTELRYTLIETSKIEELRTENERLTKEVSDLDFDADQLERENDYLEEENRQHNQEFLKLNNLLRAEGLLTEDLSPNVTLVDLTIKHIQQLKAAREQERANMDKMALALKAQTLLADAQGVLAGYYKNIAQTAIIALAKAGK